MPTVQLTPVSALDDAVAKMHAAARALLPLVAQTLHHQFPAGAWLVLTRPYEYEGYDHVRLDSVRGPDGEGVFWFARDLALEEQLPAVPEELAALWGELDPRQARDVLELIDRIDVVAPYEVLDFLPERVQTAAEIDEEQRGGRTVLGVPLPCQCGRPGGECAPCCGAKPCPAVCSDCAPWRS